MRLGWWVFGEGDQRFHSYHVLSRVHTVTMTYHCGYSRPSGWGIVRQAPSPPSHSSFRPYCPLWKDYPCLRSGELCFPALGWNVYLIYLEFFCMETSVFSHLFSQSFIYISMDAWIFYSLGCDPILCCLFWCSNGSSFGHGRSFTWLLRPFDKAPSLRPFFWHYISCSRLILYMPCSSPRSSHVSRSCVFLLENVSGNLDPRSRYAHCCWGVTASSPFQLTEQEMYVCILAYVFMYISVCIHLNLYWLNRSSYWC